MKSEWSIVDVVVDGESENECGINRLGDQRAGVYQDERLERNNKNNKKK